MPELHHVSGGRQYGLPLIAFGGLEGLQPKAATDSIHRHVTCTQDSNLFSHFYRGIEFRETVCLHKINAGQKFVCRHYTVEVYARYAHEGRQARPCAEEHCIILGKEFIKSECSTYDMVFLNFYSQTFNRITDFSVHYRLRETEFGNTINKNPARPVERFEYGDVMTFSAEIDCAGQT